LVTCCSTSTYPVHIPQLNPAILPLPSHGIEPDEQAVPILPSTARMPFPKSPSRPGRSNLGVNNNKRQMDIPPYIGTQLPGRFKKQDLAALESQVGRLYDTIMPLARVS
jgi:hypothetical protein